MIPGLLCSGPIPSAWEGVNYFYYYYPVKGKGLYLRPHRVGIIPTSYGDGLFLKHGQDIHDGKGLILGANSPFKNIPILGWIL